MTLPRRTVVGLGMALLASATACSVILGLRDGTIDRDGGVDGSTDTAVSDADIDRGTPPPPDGPPVDFDGSSASCDAGLNPATEDNKAVHVDPSPVGNDLIPCGAPESPCKTLGRALQRLVQIPATKIELANGIYNEAVTINALNNITIEGGFTNSGGVWSGSCADDGVRIENFDAGPPNNGTLHVTNASVTLRLFTVRSMFTNGSYGGSVHAIVTENSNVVLENMSIASQYGARGFDGIDAVPPGPNFACIIGDGSDGADAGPTGPGVYGSGGYAAPVGQLGQAGQPGTAGGTGELGTPFVGCRMSCFQNPEAGTCGLAQSGQSGSGEPGCGGSGGFGGGFAQGGGGSVALVALGSGTLTLQGVRFAVGAGGQGGLGGAGSAGTAGRAGDAGATTICYQCGPFPSCAPTSTTTYLGGPGGDAGGPGGRGGSGSNGNGGPAHWVAHQAGVTVLTPGPGVKAGAPGAGGPGGGSAPAGPSATIVAIP